MNASSSDATGSVPNSEPPVVPAGDANAASVPDTAGSVPVEQVQAAAVTDTTTTVNQNNNKRKAPQPRKKTVNPVKAAKKAVTDDNQQQQQQQQQQQEPSEQIDTSTNVSGQLQYDQQPGQYRGADTGKEEEKVQPIERQISTASRDIIKKQTAPNTDNSRRDPAQYFGYSKPKPAIDYASILRQSEHASQLIGSKLKWERRFKSNN